jgi:uncharacterized protein YndB with AHSA1/START domain
MTDGHPLTLDRTLAASRANLWRCWTEPELLMRWFCPKPWNVTHAEHDLRPGGRMNNVMQGPDGERFENRGVWLEVTPMQRLVFTDAFTEGFMPTAEPFMTGVVEFEDAGAGRTRMRWSARHGTAEASERHLAMGWEAGWNAATDQLEALARSLDAITTNAQEQRP